MALEVVNVVLEELLSRRNKSDILEGEEEEESDIVWAAGLFEAKDGLEPGGDTDRWVIVEDGDELEKKAEDDDEE